jgi:hypothetical protein
MRTSLVDHCEQSRTYCSTRSLSGRLPKYIVTEHSYTDEPEQVIARTETEHIAITDELLNTADLRSLNEDAVLDAASCINYWSRTRTANGIQKCISLIELVNEALLLQPKFESKSPDLMHWYVGKYPRMTVIINAFLDSWRIVLQDPTSHVLSPEEMWRFLQDEVKRQPKLFFNNRTFTHLMHGSLARYDPVKTPAFCRDLLTIMVTSDDQRIQPDVLAYTLAISAICRHDDPNVGQGAHEMLQEWEDLNKRGILYAKPNTISYNTVMERLIKTGQMSDLNAAGEILHKMFLSKDPLAQPNAASLRIVMYTWLNMQPLTVSAWETARDLLYKCLLTAHENDQVHLFDVSFFSKLMATALYDLKRTDLAEQVFLDLEKFQKMTDSKQLLPDVRVMRNLIVIYSNTSHPEEALRVLNYLILKARAEKDLEAYPKHSHYRDVIVCWIMSEHPSWVERAEEILYMSIDADLERGVKTNDILLERILYGLLKSRRPDTVKKAEDLMSRFQQKYPQVKVYDLTLRTMEKIRAIKHKRSIARGKR